jgi:hypothetical protein
MAYREGGSELGDAVLEAVDRILSARPPREALSEREFLAEARAALPPRLYAKVKRFYSETSEPPVSLGPARSA